MLRNSIGFLIFFVYFSHFSDASMLQMRAKEGDEVKLDAFRGASAIKRIVNGKTQIYDFDKKFFADEKGNRIDDSSSYESPERGVLIIKKAKKALDAGTYERHPSQPRITQNSDGSSFAVGDVQVIISFD